MNRDIYFFNKNSISPKRAMEPTHKHRLGRSSLSRAHGAFLARRRTQPTLCAPFLHHLVTELPVTIKSQVPLDHDGSPARPRALATTLPWKSRRFSSPTSRRRILVALVSLRFVVRSLARSLALHADSILSPVQTAAIRYPRDTVHAPTAKVKTASATV